jgi:hypothetical protein
MMKRCVILFGTVLISFVLGCSEQPKVVKPEGEVAPPPTDEADMFQPEPQGMEMGGSDKAPKGQ